MIAWRAAAAMAFALAVCGFGDSSGMATHGTEREDVPAPSLGTPREAARIFFSGHSLTDNPLPDDMAAVAQSLGTPMRWNQQNITGSSIKQRTRGEAATGWLGYGRGRNRAGESLNVVDELRRPQTIGEGRYDALVITEQHTLLGSLVWNDTVRYLRHFNDRLQEGNPQATTYLYHSWLGLNDRDDPRRWIAYEREASQAWRCVAARVNRSFAAEGRRDRIEPLPAAEALAALVERATQGPGMPGVSGSSVRETVDRLFADDVHYTPLGAYYLALVSYATVYHRSPVGAWAPPGVTAEQAAALQTFARDFTADEARRSQAPTLESCRTFLLSSFIGTYWSYVRDTIWTKETGTVQAYARWVRHVVGWRYRFWRENAENPLHFDALSDAAYWYPPP